MQTFIELLKDHELLIAAGKSLAAITREAEPRPAVAFATLRRLHRLLETHLRAEAAFIAQDNEDSRGEFPELAALHDERLWELAEIWRRYIDGWDAQAIEDDWRGFGEETARILGMLARQVNAENESLYPMAQRYGLIRLLPEKVHAA